MNKRPKKMKLKMIEIEPEKKRKKKIKFLKLDSRLTETFQKIIKKILVNIIDCLMTLFLA